MASRLESKRVVAEPVEEKSSLVESEKVGRVAQSGFESLKRAREVEIVSPAKKRRLDKKAERVAKARDLLNEANRLAREDKGKHAHLDLAIQKYHDAFYMNFDDEWLKSAILLQWGMALLQRNNPAQKFQKPIEEITPEERVYGELSDADQALARFHEGLVRLKHDVDLDGRLTLGLAKAYYKKYESSLDEGDIRMTLQYCQDGLIAPIGDNQIRAGLFKEQGNAFREVDELQKACESYEKGLALAFRNDVLRQNLQTAHREVQALI